MEKAKGNQYATLQAERKHIPKLEELGIDYNQSYRWQKIADIPEPAFEQYTTYVKYPL